MDCWTFYRKNDIMRHEREEQIMKNIEGKILKVIYYDENAAMDYVTIIKVI